MILKNYANHFICYFKNSQHDSAKNPKVVKKILAKYQEIMLYHIFWKEGKISIKKNLLPVKEVLTLTPVL